MKLLVTRTSDQFRRKYKPRPCEEAFLDSCITSKNKVSGKTTEEKAWFIKITSLKQLNDFIKKYGCVILDNESIEIYDDYIV